MPVRGLNGSDSNRSPIDQRARQRLTACALYISIAPNTRANGIRDRQFWKNARNVRSPIYALNEAKRAYRIGVFILYKFVKFQDKSGSLSKRGFVDRILSAQFPILFPRNGISHFFRIIFCEFVMQYSQHTPIGQMRTGGQI